MINQLPRALLIIIALSLMIIPKSFKTYERFIISVGVITALTAREPALLPLSLGILLGMITLTIHSRVKSMINPPLTYAATAFWGVVFGLDNNFAWFFAGAALGFTTAFILIEARGTINDESITME